MNYQRKHRHKVKVNKGILIFCLLLPIILVFGAFFGGLAVGSATTENSSEPTGTSPSETQKDNDSGIAISTAPEFTPLECELSEDLQEYTYYLCKDYEVDYCFVMGLMFTESAFVADSISITDDYGLMQINACNADYLEDKLGIADLLEPYQNIQAGLYILKGLFEKYGNESLVCMAYNMGEYGASQLWDSGIYSTIYSEKVIAKAQEYSLQKGVSE